MQYDFVTQIMRFEDGELPDTEVVDLFQYLIDSGLAWRLQGSYGRLAQHLLDEAVCVPSLWK